MSPALDRIEVVRADITTLDVDAVVNAANASLCGGGGVDGAIHRAAGPELLAHCRTLGGSKTGEVTYTPGFGLRAKAILHAVGPVWYGGDRNERALLRACYVQACALCREHDLHTVAFPAISTGAYRFPLREATQIAIEAVQEALQAHRVPHRVTFCCFADADVNLYRDVLAHPPMDTRSGPS